MKPMSMIDSTLLKAKKVEEVKSVEQQQNQSMQDAVDEDDEKFYCPYSQCPYKQTPLDHIQIIDHILQDHENDGTNVCPICVARGGDKTKMSMDLQGHLTYRHLNDELYAPTEELVMKLVEKMFKREEKRQKMK